MDERTPIRYCLDISILVDLILIYPIEILSNEPNINGFVQTVRNSRSIWGH
jgi:hypothetical protein